MALMGIDIGTTGCKCVIFSVGGELLAKSSLEYNRPVGATEFDGQAVWDVVRRTAAQAIRDACVTVKAVCCASLGEAIAPIGRDGTPLHPFMQSIFNKGAKHIAVLPESVKERVRQVTGLTPLPRYSLSKLLYMKNELPEIHRAAWKYMILGDFISYCLSGVPATDYSAASRTAAFNLDEKQFDAPVLAAAELDPSRMPDVYPTGTIVGTVLPGVAAELGLDAGTPVVLGGHDSIPENLCTGLFSPDMAVLGCGTFEGLGVLIPARPGPNPQLLAHSLGREPYPVGNQEFVNAVNPNGGNSVKWFRDELGRMECALAAETGKDAYQILDTIIPPEPTSLLMVPQLTGSGLPDFNAACKGTIAGITIGTTKGELYRALYEGIAYENACIVQGYRECGIAVQTIRATSGGAKSRPGLSIRADVLGVPITPMHTPDTTVTGCAMLAGVAIGAYPSLESAAELYVRKGETIEPDPVRHRHYAEMFGKYLDLRQRMRDFWTEAVRPHKK